MAIALNDAGVLQAADNIAKTISDVLVMLPTSSNVTTVVNDLNTEITRIRASTDPIIQGVILSAYLYEIQTAKIGSMPGARIIGWLENMNYAACVQNGPFPILDGMDLLVTLMAGAYSGMNHWANVTGNVVHPYFADTFNAFVTAATNGTYIRTYGSGSPVAIASAQVFTSITVDTIKLITAASSSTVNMTNGTMTLAPLAAGMVTPGGGVLEAYAKNAIGASSYTVQINYTTMANVSGQTATITVPANTALNTVLAISGISTAVASIQSATIASGSATTGDQIGLRLKPVRTIAA